MKLLSLYNVLLLIFSYVSTGNQNYCSVVWRHTMEHKPATVYSHSPEQCGLLQTNTEELLLPCQALNYAQLLFRNPTQAITMPDLPDST